MTIFVNHFSLQVSAHLRFLRYTIGPKKIKFADDGDDDDIYGGVDNYDGDNDGDVDDNDDVGGGDDGFSGKVRRLLHHHQCLCSGQNSQV